MQNSAGSFFSRSKRRSFGAIAAYTHGTPSASMVFGLI